MCTWIECNILQLFLRGSEDLSLALSYSRIEDSGPRTLLIVICQMKHFTLKSNCMQSDPLSSGIWSTHWRIWNLPKCSKSRVNRVLFWQTFQALRVRGRPLPQVEARTEALQRGSSCHGKALTGDKVLLTCLPIPVLCVWSQSCYWEKLIVIVICRIKHYPVCRLVRSLHCISLIRVYVKHLWFG